MSTWVAVLTAVCIALAVFIGSVQLLALRHARRSAGDQQSRS